jgi:hypothetical protein
MGGAAGFGSLGVATADGLASEANDGFASWAAALLARAGHIRSTAANATTLPVRPARSVSIITSFSPVDDVACSSEGRATLARNS